MATFSSSGACNARVTCSSQVLPTMATTGAPLSSSAAKPSSSRAATPFFRVEPNATTWACARGSSRIASKNAMSFGFDEGNPPSMKSMPKASKRWAMLSLSFSDSAMPCAWPPSRSVES